MSEWKPIKSVQAQEGDVAILFQGNRVYHGVDGDDIMSSRLGRDYGCMLDIGVFIEGRWVEAYSGHDTDEEWQANNVPTHVLMLPKAPDPETTTTSAFNEGAEG